MLRDTSEQASAPWREVQTDAEETNVETVAETQDGGSRWRVPATAGAVLLVGLLLLVTFTQTDCFSEVTSLSVANGHRTSTIDSPTQSR
ncbi:MAG: hypothetical protein ABEN55_24185 [Bradymonadaceae bacterium]